MQRQKLYTHYSDLERERNERRRRGWVEGYVFFYSTNGVEGLCERVIDSRSVFQG